MMSNNVDMNLLFPGQDQIVKHCRACRWSLAMAPVHRMLASVSEATISQHPETAYQRTFQADLAPHIQKAVTAFRKAAGKGFTYAPQAPEILKQITARVEQYCRCCAKQSLIACTCRCQRRARCPAVSFVKPFF